MPGPEQGSSPTEEQLSAEEEQPSEQNQLQPEYNNEKESEWPKVLLSEGNGLVILAPEDHSIDAVVEEQDEQGRPIVAKMITDSGKFLVAKSYEYSQDGSALTRRTEFRDENSNLIGIEDSLVEELDDGTTRQVDKYTNGNGEYYGYKVYIFDELGNVISFKVFSKDGVDLTPKEIEDEEEEEKEESAASGSADTKKAPKNEKGPNNILGFKEEMVEYKYDKKGRKIAEIYSYQDGGLSRSIEYQRDDSGKILRILFRNGLGKIIKEMVP